MSLNTGRLKCLCCGMHSQQVHIAAAASTVISSKSAYRLKDRRHHMTLSSSMGAAQVLQVKCNTRCCAPLLIPSPPHSIHKPCQSCTDQQKKTAAECSCQVQVELFLLEVKGRLPHHYKEENPNTNIHPAQQKSQQQKPLHRHR